MKLFLNTILIQISRQELYVNSIPSDSAYVNSRRHHRAGQEGPRQLENRHKKSIAHTNPRESCTAQPRNPASPAGLVY